MKQKHLSDKFRVDDGKHFRLKDFDPADTGHLHSKEHAADALQKGIARMAELQDKLYAQDQLGAAADFSGHGRGRQRRRDQARDVGSESAGLPGVFVQDAVGGGIAARFSVAHDRVLPERGHIGIFNRSYYEEVLVVRVHPEILQGQKTAASLGREKHLGASGSKTSAASSATWRAMER